MVVHNAYEVGIRLGAMTAELLKKFKDFVYSDPNIENAAAENIRWQPIRTLGAGGMGLVALWKKYNAEEVVIDVVAIKQEEWEDWKQYTGLRKGLSFEAIYQHQLNVLPNGENTLKIRRYRYYDNDEQTRYYFEFCPHQDLDELRQRYRAWDTYLPELFLWHLFVSLAKTAALMEKGENPWKRLTPTGWVNNWRRNADAAFLLHMDLKPDNIFLGDPPNEDFANDPTSIYPQIEVADFGISELFGSFNRIRNHPGHINDAGTEGFRPPGQILLGAGWQSPPNGQRCITGAKITPDTCKGTIRNGPDGHGIRYSAKFNIWGIGKIMRDMLRLDSPDEYNNRIKGYPPHQQAARYGQFGLEMRGRDTNAPAVGYSAELMDLIEECMEIEASCRPSAADLLARTTAGLDTRVQNVKTNGIDAYDPTIKVYFTGNDINQMPRGQTNLDAGLSSDAMANKYKKVVDNQYKDLRWGKLKLPYTKWRREIDDDIANARGVPVWPTGEGPFRWDGIRVIVQPDYAWSIAQAQARP